MALVSTHHLCLSSLARVQALRQGVPGLCCKEESAWWAVVAGLWSPAGGGWPPHLTLTGGRWLFPPHHSSHLPYSGLRNPGSHNAWVLSRQVTETLIPASLSFLIPPPQVPWSVRSLPFPVPSRRSRPALEEGSSSSPVLPSG